MDKTRTGIEAVALTFVVLLTGITTAVGQAPHEVPLVAAVRAGDVDAVQRLIRDGVEVDAGAGDGATALHWAAYSGDLQLVRTLLDAGAEPHAANRLGVTPLLLASRFGHALVMAALLEAGADATTVYRDGETALMAVAEAGSVEGVQLLLARGTDVNAKEQLEDQTALIRAAAEGHAAVVRVLLDAGADPNANARPTTLARERGPGGRMWVDWSSGGLSPLMFAAREGHLEASALLVEAGANIDYANPDGLTPLTMAILNDRLDLAGMLIEKGASVDEGSLYEAVRLHNLRTNETAGDSTRPRPWHENTLTPLDIVERLIARGADPHRQATHTLHVDGTGQPGPINETPMARAITSQDVAAVRVMLSGGADPNATAPNGVTPLVAAAGGGGGGGRGGFAGGFGAQPAGFRFTAERDAIGVARVLIDAGADVDAAGGDGSTALHAAAQAGNVEMIRLLAAAGATLDAPNAAGFTPLDAAMGRIPPPAGAGAGGGRGGRGGGGGPRPQPEAIALLRELMGLPAEPVGGNR